MFTFKKDTENQCDNFYLVYRHNLLFAKCDAEDGTIRFYDKDASVDVHDLQIIVSKMTDLHSQFLKSQPVS